MAESILGVHHVTAIACDPDLDSDTRLLALRPVNITVDFDDPASTSTAETVAAIQALFSLSFCGPARAAATQLRSGSEQSPELKKED
jgi:hypothetical protein